MKIYAREYKWYKDLFFQSQILFDKSIQHFMFDNKRKMFEYFLPSCCLIKYVIIKEHNHVKKRVSIMTFLKDRRAGFCWIAGFVPTHLQNKGMGIYGGIAAINELFRLYPECTVLSASYSFNMRAIRATKSFGFDVYVENDSHFEGSLTKEQFDNEFVRLVKARCCID